MTRLTRTIRALILALVLPALLVPSGWSARLCLCGWGGPDAAESCCEEPETARESDDQGFESCCSSRHDDPQAPVASERSGCGDGACGDCCQLVESDGVELVFASPVHVAVPAPAFACELEFKADLEPRTVSRLARACTHSLAPPRASTPLPLRI